MTPFRTQASFIGLRGELLAELFLQELGPVSLLRSSTQDAGFDFLVAFPNADGGVNTFAVEVKATEQELRSRFPINAHLLRRLAASNIPVFFLVVDVKRNRLFYSWPDQEAARSATSKKVILVSITELTESNKKALLKRLRSREFRWKGAN